MLYCTLQGGGIGQTVHMTQKFVIKRVDKGQVTVVKRLWSWYFECKPFVRGLTIFFPFPFPHRIFCVLAAVLHIGNVNISRVWCYSSMLICIWNGSVTFVICRVSCCTLIECFHGIKWQILIILSVWKALGSLSFQL